MARDISDLTPIEGRQDLIDYIAGGEKPKAKWKLGTEHEKFPFYTDGNKPVPYDGPRGIRAILEGMQTMLGWEPIMDGANISSALSNPLAWVRFLWNPAGNLNSPARRSIASTRPAARRMRIWRRCAKSPNRSASSSSAWAAVRNGRWPGRRACRNPAMRSCQTTCRRSAPKGLDMMYRTCTIQVNLDFSSEQDMARKFAVSMKLQPLSTALFAASPFTDGKPNGMQSWRGDIWRDTDNNRSGILPFIFDREFGYGDYVDWALDVPMYFVLRDGHYHDATDVTFRQFMNGALRARISGG